LQNIVFKRIRKFF